MAESAAAANPNTPVQSEGTHQSRANSAISFDDVDKLDDAPRKPERKVVSGGQPTGKAKAAAAKDDEPSKGEKKPSGQKKGDDEGVGAVARKEDGGTDSEKAEKAEKDADKGEPRSKPRTHKFRSGETEIAVGGDHTLPVTINGKKEDVPLQDLINNYSGKVAYDQKFGEIGRKEQEHATRVEALNGKINGFLEKAKANPEDGWDFLAELAGQDPVPMKEQLLRGWITELAPLFAMPEDQRETWIKDKVRDWRDRRYESRQKAETEAAEKTKRTEEDRKAREPFGITDDDWDQARAVAKEHLGEEPSAEHVLYVNRYHFATSVVKEVVPDLAKHEKFGAIMDDITSTLLSYPAMTRDRLALLLKETWGKDDESLKALSRKASKNAEADGEPLTQARTRSSKSEPLTFSDL